MCRRDVGIDGWNGCTSTGVNERICNTAMVTEANNRVVGDSCELHPSCGDVLNPFSISALSYHYLADEEDPLNL